MAENRMCLGCMENYDASLDACPHCGYLHDQANPHVLHMTPGTILNKKYIVGKSIGYGSFGVTYIGWDKVMRRKVAIKEYLPSEYATRISGVSQELILPDSESQQQRFEKGKGKFRGEAEKLAKVGKVDGVVYVYDTFEENGTAYIVMEYLEGMTLAAYLKEKGTLSENETIDLMLPILQSLEEVHQANIIHRDISPDNIFITRDTAGNQIVKLIDFGAARFATSSHSKSLTVLLKPGYSPEEQYRSSGEQGPYTDVYAVSAVMYQMVTGVVPPDALERRTAIERKKRDILEDPTKFNKDLSGNFVTAVLNALNVRIEDRTPTAEAFVEELISFEKVKRHGSSIKLIDFYKWPLWAKISVSIGSVAAIALIGGIAYWLAHLTFAKDSLSLPDGYTYVVDFSQKDRESAMASAEAHKLNFVEDAPEYSSRIMPDYVIRQDINPFMVVLENSDISLVFSSKEEDYSLPDVVGYTEEEARAALECMDLQVISTIGEKTPGVARGCVLEQDLAPYTEVKTGDTVYITVADSADAKACTVPELVGKTMENALMAANEAGATLIVTDKIFTDEKQHTEVLTQSVAAGEGIDADTAVEVTIALSTREFKMPNLIYKPEDKANRLLKNIGMQADITTVYDELYAAGMVLDQSIEKDNTVRPGDKVTMSVCAGSIPFDMPDVTGMSEEEAKTLLGDKALPVSVEYSYDANVSVGSVISQSVAAGEKITRGTEVTIIVCSDKELAEVPNVVGMAKDGASDLLKEKGLKVQIVEAYNDTVMENHVIIQQPEAGTMQLPGTVIVLNVSKGPTPVEDIKETGNNESGSATTKPQTVRPNVPESGSNLLALPNGVNDSNANIQTKTQYSVSKRSTTTSNSSSMSGWVLYDTKSNYSSWGGYGDWTTDYVANSDTCRGESATQYQYRDWVQTGEQKRYTTITEWKDGYLIPDKRYSDMEEREVVDYNSYKMAHYCTGKYATIPYQNSSTLYPSNYPNFASECQYHELGWFTDAQLAAYEYDGSRDAYRMDRCSTTGYWYWKLETQPHYKHQYRQLYFEMDPVYDWTGYSGWDFNPVSAIPGQREVQTRTVYHYQYRNKETVYYFEQWSGNSDWSDTPASSDANTNVQTRTVYSYTLK